MKDLKFISIIAASLFLFACASGAQQQNMVYESSELMTYDNQLTNSVSISNTYGGRKTKRRGPSDISNEAFSNAVKESLSMQGLLSRDGRYRLQIILVNIDQPSWGLDFEVTTHVKYTLTDSSDNSVIFDETIVTPYTSTVGDAWVAIERIRLANEGSSKENIKGFLEKLSELNIQENQISFVD